MQQSPSKTQNLVLQSIWIVNSDNPIQILSKIDPGIGS